MCFTGLSRYGEGFARDLGHLFEQYIGRQLRLLPGSQVLGEVTYGPRNDRRKTVDWIVILPEVVLVVEVKSAIPTEPVRLGTPEAAGAVLVKLGKAFKQIDVSQRRVRPAPRYPHAGHRGGRSRDREPGHDHRHLPRTAAARPCRRRRALNLVARHRVRGPHPRPQPGPGRGLGLLPVGIGRPRLPWTVPLSPADPGGDPAAVLDVPGRPVLTRLQAIRGIRSRLASSAR